MVAIQADVAICSMQEEICLHNATQDVEWVVDTAASYHVTPHRDYFTTYKAGDFGAVKMGNISSSGIVGMGDIQLRTNVGCTLTLKDVLHVPELRLNVLSGIALDKQGYDNHFRNGTWRMTKGVMVVARGHACGALYKTRVKICSDSLKVAEKWASQNLWNQRLGHMSGRGLSTLNKKELTKDAARGPCNHYSIGKQRRVSFDFSSERRLELLSLVHSDVCGPLEVDSLGGNKYFLTFIDDASRKIWVYFLKTKDQVLDQFKLFHAMVEHETGKKLKCLRTDYGGKYNSREFEAYCRRFGIRHERTVPHTPQHNGVTTSMDRTIMEKVRGMISMAKLPKPLWG